MSSDGSSLRRRCQYSVGVMCGTAVGKSSSMTRTLKDNVPSFMGEGAFSATWSARNMAMSYGHGLEDLSGSFSGCERIQEKLVVLATWVFDLVCVRRASMAVPVMRGC